MLLRIVGTTTSRDSTGESLSARIVSPGSRPPLWPGRPLSTVSTSGWWAGAIAFRHDGFVNRPAKSFVARPAEDFFGLRIPTGDRAIAVDTDDGIQRGLEDQAHLFFPGRPGFLAAHAVGDVGDGLAKGGEPVDES